VVDVLDQGRLAAVLFFVILALNVLPAFAPPTWTTMSFVGLAAPNVNFLLIAGVAATAATSGRIVLALLSDALIRRRFLSDRARHNVDAIRLGIENRPMVTFGTLLGYSCSPLPSNYLFIAYGLTALPLSFLALPFLIGRFVSYAFWLWAGFAVGDALDWGLLESTPYFVGYYIMSQLLLVPAIYGFTRLDWRGVFAERRLRWLAAKSNECN
jgi:membrane protein YqaA with SNARE-associated domain